MECNDGDDGHERNRGRATPLIRAPRRSHRDDRRDGDEQGGRARSRCSGALEGHAALSVSGVIVRH
jgi:hypothetical protein